MIALPKDNLAWSKEVQSAFKDAMRILVEAEQDVSEKFNEQLFIAAPVVAMMNRQIDFTEHRDAVDFACGEVLKLLKSNPELQKQYKRCFTNAYLDSYIFLELIDQEKKHQILDFLSQTEVIES